MENDGANFKRASERSKQMHFMDCVGMIHLSMNINRCVGNIVTTQCQLEYLSETKRNVIHHHFMIDCRTARVLVELPNITSRFSFNAQYREIILPVIVLHWIYRSPYFVLALYDV